MTFTCAAAGFFVFACIVPDQQIDAARFCKTASPITYSGKDTPETRRQVRIHNAKWTAVCGRGAGRP
ncbi:hypothetical protein [Methylobacterium sp. ID0610]|uniref:hypothetical protein n=1 Tax=Methylobacterium carpenticola TaxID=3344827 RepID=UPI0036A43071